MIRAILTVNTSIVWLIELSKGGGESIPAPKHK